MGSKNKCFFRRSIFILALLFSLTDLYGQNKIPPINKNDFSVFMPKIKNQIYLGEDIDEVVNSLGKPNEQSLVKKGVSKEWDIIGYIYNDIEVHFFSLGKKIINIEVKGPSFTTPRGIGIGNNLSDIIRVYGSPQYQNTKWVSYYLPLPGLGGIYVLSLIIESDAVKTCIISNSD
jgi:hypothetical protein